MRSESSSVQRPFASTIALAGILFLLITAKLVELQLVRGDYYRELSSRNHIRSVITQAPRGQIIDRNGVVLADNEPSFTVSLVHAEFDPAEASLLRDFLGMDEEILSERLEAAGRNPFRATVLATGLNVMEAGRIADNLYRLGGVSVEVLPRRRYPHGREFCHLVGYVGLADSTRVFEGEISGRTGLERVFNERLTGRHGVVREVVDATGGWWRGSRVER